MKCILHETSYLGEIMEITFKCPVCKHYEFDRPTYSTAKTFLEGHFCCLNCGEVFNYYADCWIKTVVGVQPSLFV
jgi:transposase-like protein